MLIISVIIIIVTVDQICKNLADSKIKEGCYVPIIKNKLYIGNVKNKGAAMGMFSERPKALKLFSALAMVSAMLLLFSSFKKDNKNAGKLGAALIVAGGISNIFDRIFKSQVTDYLYIKYKKLPVFNIADLAIFIGAVINFFAEIKRK